MTENGFEQIKSALANDIFHNDLYQVYEKQTDVRDKLRSEAKNLMTDLLSKLQNNNEFDPLLEQLILKLQSQLKNSKGKKVYGYLQPNVKKTVDQIVAELAKNPLLKKMYVEWCELERQKYEIYTSAVQKFPPLEENKVFKPIKNAVIKAMSEMEFPAIKIEDDDEIFMQEDLEDSKEEKSTVKKYSEGWRKDCRKAFKFLANSDYISAYKLFCKIADEKPNDKILLRLGIMTIKGLGCDADWERGIEYISQSAELGNEYAQNFLEQMDHRNQFQVQSALVSMLFSFGKLISDDYNRSLRGQAMRTEHKLKSAIRRKKQALGLKESQTEQKF